MRLTRASAVLLVGLVAVAGSGAGLANGFTDDDLYVIGSNNRVHSLDRPLAFLTATYWPPVAFRGDHPLYRPLTTVVFALQWVAGHGTPLPFHLISLLLYLLIAIAVLGLAAELLPLGPATLGALLFASHPVHVEAVASAGGQAELWVGLGAVVAVWAYLRGRNAGGLDRSARYIIYACYLGACLAREDGVLLIGLLVVAELALTPAPGDLRARLASLRDTLVILVGIAALSLMARVEVIGSLTGDLPHPVIAQAGLTQRSLTMLPVVSEWLRLFFWPARLQVEYGPREILPAHGFGPAQELGLLLLLTAAALVVWAWRRRPVLGFGLAWAAVALLPASNLLFKSGALLAERTLLLPSIGVILAVAAAVALADWRPGARRAVVIVGLIATGLGLARTALRQPDWRSNTTLYGRLTIDAPESYRGHALLAGDLFWHGRRPEAMQQMFIALALYPDDPTTWSDTGELYRAMGQCDWAIPLYRRAIAMDHQQANVRARMASCLMRLGQFGAARVELQSLIAEGHPQFQFFLPIVDSAEHSAHSTQGP